MSLCKIGSTSTYSNCLSDMHRWGWINYRPSNSKYGASTVSLANWSDASLQQEHKREKNKSAMPLYLETTRATSSPTTTQTSSETTSETTNKTTTEPQVGHSIKTYKQQTENKKDLTVLKKNYYEPL
jgi:hypothetical protein